MRIGFHIPIRFGLSRVAELADERGCSTVQVFTRAPQNWRINKLENREVAAFRDGMAARDIAPVFVHTQYLLSLGTHEAGLRERSVRSLLLDLNRAALLGAPYVVTHIGSAGQANRSTAVRRVSRAVDAAMANAAECVMLLLENSAAAGSLLGGSPAELADVICGSAFPDRLGVCMDTSHAFAAGHSITTATGLDDFLGEMDRCFGLERLRLIHLNDSKAPFGSRVDRHWHIGRGEMGEAALARILNHPRLRDLPFIMETPGFDLRTDRMNMRAVRRLCRGAPE